MTENVFIISSEEDLPIVKLLSTELSKVNKGSFFIDYRAEPVRRLESIEYGLVHSSYVILLLNMNATRSIWVRDTVKWSNQLADMDKNRINIVLLLEIVQNTLLPHLDSYVVKIEQEDMQPYSLPTAIDNTIKIIKDIGENHEGQNGRFRLRIPRIALFRQQIGDIKWQTPSRVRIGSNISVDFTFPALRDVILQSVSMRLIFKEQLTYEKKIYSVDAEGNASTTREERKESYEHVIFDFKPVASKVRLVKGEPFSYHDESTWHIPKNAYPTLHAQHHQLLWFLELKILGEGTRTDRHEVTVSNL